MHVCRECLVIAIVIIIVSVVAIVIVIIMAVVVITITMADVFIGVMTTPSVGTGLSSLHMPHARSVYMYYFTGQPVNKVSKQAPMPL